MKQFKDFFKTEVTSLLANAMTESFDDAFLELLNPTIQDDKGNVIISDITKPIYPLPNTNEQVWLNYSMMAGNPIIQNNSASFAFEGTYLDAKKKPLIETNTKPLLPLPSTNEHKAVNMIISEYAIRSAINAYHKAGPLFYIQYAGLS